MSAAYNKFYVALVTAGAAAVANGLFVGTSVKVFTVVTAFAGAFGVYAVANRPGPESA